MLQKLYGTVKSRNIRIGDVVSY